MMDVTPPANEEVSMTIPLVAGLGTPELLIILAVVVLLFGASKLPDLARNSGRALRIFKSETKGLLSDDDKTPEQLELERRNDSERPNSTD
jgi:sec-independent protein translocase protein TatA